MNSIGTLVNITGDIGTGYIAGRESSVDMSAVIEYVDAQFEPDMDILLMMADEGAMAIVQDSDGAYLVDTDGALLVGM